MDVREQRERGRMWWLVCICAMLCLAGCTSLQLKGSLRATESDWLTEGGTAERRHVSEVDLKPPLEIAWKYNARAAFGPGSPLMLRDYLFISNRKGEVHAIRIEDGKRVGQENFGESIEGAPILHDEMMFIPVAWGKKSLHAYDLSTAKTKWHVKGTAIEMGLLSLDSLVVAVDMGAKVRAYRAEEGSVRWEYAIGKGIRVNTTPVLAEGNVVMTTDKGIVLALQAVDGEVHWTKTLDTPVYASMATDGEQLYIPTTRGRFFALNASNGSEAWKIVEADTTLRFSPPAVDDEIVVVGATDGILRCLNAEDGKPKWTFAIDAAFASAPLITPSTVFIGSMGRMLYALDRNTGALLWEEKLDGRVKSAMALRDDQLVVLAEPNVVYLFKPISENDDVASR